LKVLLKILEILGMIVALPIVLLWGVHGLIIIIGIVWILVSDQEPGIEELSAIAAIALLIKLVQFIIKEIKNK
jgi:uncharacterized membrane protein